MVECGVAPGEEDALIFDLPPLEVFPDDVVHRHHLFAFLEERDDADVLGVEVAYPVADGASVRQVPALLSGDELRVVVPHLDDLVGVGGEREDDFLDGRFEVAVVELVRDVVGDGDAMESLDEELAHLQFYGRIGDAEGNDGVAPQFLLFGEVAGVVGEELLDDVRVGVLALRVPHLLVATERQHVGSFDDLAVALDHPVDGVGRGLRIVRVLGAHHSRDQGQSVHLRCIRGNDTRIGASTGRRPACMRSDTRQRLYGQPATLSSRNATEMRRRCDRNATEMRQAIHFWSGSPQERGGGSFLLKRRILSHSQRRLVGFAPVMAAGDTPRPITSVPRVRGSAKGADVASAGMQAKGRGPCLRRNDGARVLRRHCSSRFTACAG